MQKLVFVIYNSALESEFMRSLQECSVTGFTKFEKVSGSGNSGSHFGDKIWPGVNSMVMVGAEEDKVRQLVEQVKKLRADFPKLGIKALVLPLEEIA